MRDERDKANIRETELICERDYFKKELDAERDNRESIESINKSLARAVERLREQLAAAEKALSEEVDCVHKTLMQLAAEKEMVQIESKRANEAERKLEQLAKAGK